MALLTAEDFRLANSNRPLASIFADFWDCFTGPNPSPGEFDCPCLDIDSDGDVDLVDFGLLQVVF